MKKINKDIFLEARGGYCHVYTLSCTKCKKKLGGYQKDGPGPLKRLYHDRCTPSLLKSIPDYKSGKRWDCPKCGSYLGLAALYKKERRPAWYLLVESIYFSSGRKINPKK